MSAGQIFDEQGRYRGEVISVEWKVSVEDCLTEPLANARAAMQALSRKAMREGAQFTANRARMQAAYYGLLGGGYFGYGSDALRRMRFPEITDACPSRPRCYFDATPVAERPWRGYS